MSRSLAVLLAASSAVAALALSGCGTSYQARYEADVHFARCYRYDADANVAREARLQCWQSWRNGYAGTQTRDRDEHAASRVSQLERGDVAMAGPVVQSPPAAPPSTAVRSPGPPPGTMALNGGDPPGLTSTQLCQRDCGLSFTSCVQKCDKTSCMQKCGDITKLCISECL